MSDYPYYGAAYGNRDQSNNPPYPTYSNHSAYYPQDDGRSGQHAMTQGYDNTMAYGYNQQQLPNYSAPAMQNNIPPVPVFQGWNQENSSMPQYNAAPQGMHSYAGYNHQNYAQNSQYYAPVAAPQPAYHSQTPAYGNVENREMSEGEFDDTSAHMRSAAPNASIGAPGSRHYRGNDGTGYLDTAHRAVYPTGQDPAPQQPPPTLRNAADYYNQRQPSASYSPFIAQSEPLFDQIKNSQMKDTGAGKGPLNVKKGGAQKKSKPQSPVGEPNNTASKSGQENIPSFTQGQVSEAVGCSHPSQADAYNDTVTFKTVAEARKKAEGAILNLWSYDVRFPAYLEEGVDEKLVGELFDELRLSKTATKTISAASAQSPSTSVSSAPHSGLPATSGHPNSQVSAQSSTDKSKQAITNGGTAPSATAQPKSAAAVEKEKTMQAKMDALRKSRAERAQKNAAKSVTTTATSLPSAIAHAKPTIIPELPTSVPNSTSSAEKVVEKNKVGTTDSSSSASIPALTVTTQFPQSSAPPSNIQQTSQKIPGLFLASIPPAPSSVPQTIMPTPVLNGQRKRPVAADFDGPSTSTIPLKRPFGQSRVEPKPFVICVSEDEDESDEDVEMELESQADADSPVQPPRKLPEQKALPTASSFLPPKPFTPPPTSSTSTPPNLQSSIKPHPEDLRRKESEIEQLKRKIAEAEMRKANKRTSSGAQTPINNVATSTSNIGLVASRPNSLIETQKATNISKEKTQSNAAQVAELQKAADIRKEEAELKRLRRERIASAIPRVDAEALQNQARLEELRAEIARIEAAVQKNLQDKQKLVEEMERLGQETDQQLQEQKEKLDSLTREETKDNPAEPPSASAQPDREPEPQSLAESEPKSASVPMELDDQIDDARDAMQPQEQQQQQQPEQSHTTDVAAASPISIPLTQPDSVNDIAYDTTEDHSSEVKEASETNQDLEAALQEAVRADADSVGPSDVEMEDSNAPPTQVNNVTATPNEEKASSDYSPVLERSQPLATSSTPKIPDVVDASEIADVDSDNYEPPEATPAADESSPVASSPFSPAPPDSVIGAAEDGELPESSNDNYIDLEVISNGEEQSLPAEDGSVPQLTEKPLSSDPNSSSFFTPYESPLRVFHAFRFHPEYKQQIPGGLKSITYTNKIDAKKELCRYELMGGICNDNTCDFQHFREMGLPDDAVLAKLGSPDEFEGEQRDRFIEGLKSLLSGLRARKIKDFDAIASEIVAHRAKFLGDPSKVLSLEGTTL
ncbi:uncharacterized protein EAE97_000350 [Botrytis byssoidea]|uniref:C3H1-type domain-containing protein n=1 Tax=Botrytis byssoidea TaxID=139641 RepID=A0A9P5LZF1_9HELO|nr:uncharacterized protein EAE97_000350 [Botrytis byssoidea]KAF7955091.1 hypothetical protein EAE97_000350 [Botrytis byssoidea]